MRCSSICLACRESHRPERVHVRRHCETECARDFDAYFDFEAATRPSLRISRVIGPSSRSFTDADFIKKCLMVASEEMCNWFSKIYVYQT